MLISEITLFVLLLLQVIMVKNIRSREFIEKRPKTYMLIFFTIFLAAKLIDKIIKLNQ